MKLGVSSYSFHQLVSSGAMRQIDVIERAHELGYDIIEFSTFTLENGQTAMDFAKEAAARAKDIGIDMGNYTIAADFLRHAGGVAGQVEDLRRELEVAKALGAPGMRHDAAWGAPSGKPHKSFDSVLGTLADGCRQVTAIAQDMGIRTMVENHGFYAQESALVERLMNAVGHENFGWLVDMGNFLCADEPPEQAVGRAAPYAFHVHIKDFHLKSGNAPAPGEGWFASRGGNWLRGAIVGHGEVPVMQCLRILKQSGYDGCISVEFEGIEDPIIALRIARENISHYLDML